MLNPDQFDCGILKFAIEGYARQRGIGYEEALTEMARYQRNNKPPEDVVHKKGYFATPQHAREAYHRATDKYGTWKPSTPEESFAVPEWAERVNK